MSGEKTQHSEADTEPLPLIESLLKGSHDYPEQTQPESEALRRRGFLKMAALALMPSVAVNLGLFIGFNKESIPNNFVAATSFSDENNKMSDIASLIADMPIRVDCNDIALDSNSYSQGDMNYRLLGQVETIQVPFYGRLSPPVMTVREFICEEITEFDQKATTPQRTDSDYLPYLDSVSNYAEDISIVLHEAEHNKQVLNEAEATCNAFQKLGGVLVKLGIDEELAETAAWVASVRKSETFPDIYLSDECTPGGEFDLGISDLYIEPRVDPPGSVIYLPADD
jgi:hypothetical protein